MLYFILIILFTPILSTNLEFSSEYTCDEYSCNGYDIICDTLGQNCDLTCNGPHSCTNATFTCKSDELCKISCNNGVNEEAACQSMSINTATSGLTINCESTQSCIGMNIITASKLPIISCKGEESCKQMSITANITQGSNSESKLIINCGDENLAFGTPKRSCEQLNAQIIGYSLQQSMIKCIDPGTEDRADATCRNTTIYCDVGECIVQCEEDANAWACWNSKMFCDYGAVCRSEVSNDEILQFMIIDPPPTPEPTGEAKYIAGSQVLTWNESEAFCQEVYDSHLATIVTQQDMKDAVALNVGQAWIGLNNIGSTGVSVADTEDNWNWIDGTSCDNPKIYGNDSDASCGTSIYWRHEILIQQNGNCAYLDGDEFSTALCDQGGKGFLCNGLPTVDYICVDNQDNEWIGVLKYDYFYQYVAVNRNKNENITYELEWDEFDSKWEFKMGSMLSGDCSSDTFVLPQDCTNWQFSNSSNFSQFTDCACM